MVVLHEGCVVYRKLFGFVNVIHPEIIYVHVCQECLKIVYKVITLQTVLRHDDRIGNQFEFRQGQQSASAGP